MKKHTVILIAGAAIIAALSGCVTTGTKARIKALDETRKAIDRNTTANLAGATGIVTGSVAPIEAAAVRINEGVATSDARFEKIQQELERQQVEFNTFVTGALAVVGEVATGLVPGGGAAAKALGLLKGRIETSQKAAEKAQAEGEAARQAAAAATTRAQEQVATLKSELAAKAELQKKELELVRQELTGLGVQQKAELHQELLAEAQKRGVPGAEAMSTEQLLAALGAGGFSLAALLRTMGKSRSQGEIDQLWDKLEDVKVKIAQK